MCADEEGAEEEKEGEVDEPMDVENDKGRCMTRPIASGTKPQAFGRTSGELGRTSGGQLGWPLACPPPLVLPGCSPWFSAYPPEWPSMAPGLSPRMDPACPPVLARGGMGSPLPPPPSRPLDHMVVGPCYVTHQFELTGPVVVATPVRKKGKTTKVGTSANANFSLRIVDGGGRPDFTGF